MELSLCEVSSVGRALALQARGHWFEPSTSHHKTLVMRSSAKLLTGITIIQVFNGYLISLAKRIRRKKEIVVKGCLRIIWGVGGMADTLDLGSSTARRKGSSPLLPTRESVSFLISITCYGLIEVKPDFKMTQISHSHRFNGH